MDSIETTRSGGSIKNALVVFALVFPVVVAGTYFWKKHQQTPLVPPQVVTFPMPSTLDNTPPAPVLAPQVSTVASAETGSGQAPVDAQSAAGVLPRLNSWIVYAGQEISTEKDDLSLPTGSQFAVKVKTNVDGEVAFYTINPNGISSENPLWKAKVSAQQGLVAPSMRLEGATGLETLRLLFTPEGGGDAIESHVKVWHLKPN